MHSIISSKPIEFSEEDYSLLRDELGLCGDENVSLHLDAAVSMVESTIGKSLRHHEIVMRTKGGEFSGLPYAEVEDIKSITVAGGGYNIGAHDDYMAGCGFCKSHFSSCSLAMRSLCLPLCLPDLFGCGCRACECDPGGVFYEIIYSTKPFQAQLDPRIKLAVFKQAAHFYDDEVAAPDLDKMLVGFAPTEMDKFFAMAGGMFRSIA